MLGAPTDGRTTRRSTSHAGDRRRPRRRAQSTSEPSIGLGGRQAVRARRRSSRRSGSAGGGRPSAATGRAWPPARARWPGICQSKPSRAHLVEPGQRHVHRHAVERLARARTGRSAAARSCRRAAAATRRDSRRAGRRARDRRRAASSVRSSRSGSSLPLGLPPPVEVADRRDLGADPVVVELEQHLVVDQFETPHPRRHPPDAFEELGVAGEELLPTDPRLVGDVALDSALVMNHARASAASTRS